MSLVTDLRVGREVVLAALPFCHSFGLTACLNSPIVTRSRIVMLPRFEAPKALRTIQKEEVTVFLGVPAMLEALCDHPGIRRTGFRSVRAAFSGGAVLTADLQERFEALSGVRVSDCYGLTEASPAVTGNPSRLASLRTGSIGLPLPGTQIRILEPVTLRPVPIGEIGELAVRGPQVMLGYWNAPRESARVMKDGWLLTGDLARTDADGFVYLTGRRKPMINVCGFKVYPAEIQAILGLHPKVESARVSGVPDGCRGEAVRASILLKPGETAARHEILQYCRSRMASFKVPKCIEILSDSDRHGPSSEVSA
jgi:long-chain acyl-CoA synthetase